MRLIVVVLMLVGCASEEDDREAQARQCSHLRDHLIELNLANATNVDRTAHRKAMRQALGETFVATCVEKLSARQVTCALKARDSRAAGVCGQAIASN